MSEREIVKTFRILELPKTTTTISLRKALHAFITQNATLGAEDPVKKLSVAPDPNDPDTLRIATVTFALELGTLKLFGSPDPIRLMIDGAPQPVRFNSTFTGLTTLHYDEPIVDIVAVQGLGVDAFGTWSAKGGPDMWLRDFLPETVKNSRILIYGYNANLIGPGARSFASITDLAKGLVNALISARRHSSEMERPLILIGHSLGGLVIKEALVEAASNAKLSAPHKGLYDSFLGALFFAVPNRGLNIEHLLDIVQGQPNEALIRSLNPESEELKKLHGDFTRLFDRKKYQFYSYYEGRTTQLTGINPTTKRMELLSTWAHLVTEESATGAVPTQARHNHIPIDEDHRGISKFSRTDQDFRTVRGHIVSLVEVAQKIVDDRSLKRPTDFHSRDGQPTHFIVPYIKNENYIPRQKLDGLLTNLAKSQRRGVVLGPGGTGKSESVLNLAFQIQHTRTVFWIDGYTVDSSMSSLVSIGKKLGLAKEGMKEKDLCQALKERLQSDESGNWIAIIDNLTHTDEHILDVLSASNGTLLVTTRLEDVTHKLQAAQIDCGKMNREEGRALFHKQAGIGDGAVGEADMVSMLDSLKYLPLAITLAASFIHETKMEVDQYLEIFEKELPHHEKTALNPNLRFESKDLPTPSVMAAWDITFQRIKRDKPSAAELLQLMSMLDSHNIPVDLLHFKAVVDMGLEKGSKLDSAIRVLLSYSLLTMYKEQRYQIHDLISIWTRKQMGNRQEHFTKLSLSLIDEAFQNRSSPKLIDYLPHAHAVLRHSGQVSALMKEIIAFQYKLADILHQSHRSTEAKDMIMNCIEYYGSTNPDGLEHAESAYQLALIFEAGKDYQQAIFWCGNARDGFAKNFGQSHPRTLSTLKRIAMVSEMRSDFVYAIQNYELALDWSGITAADPFIIEIFHNMALVFDKQGRYDVAAEAYSAALSNSIELSGEENPYTLDIRNNMAGSLRKQGRYEEALEMYNKVNDAYTRMLGRGHPSTLNVQGNIALIDDIQGRHEEALQKYKRVLEQKEKSMGKGSPSALSTQTNMALLLSKLGRHDEARETARSALDGLDACLGPENIATLDAMANYAMVVGAGGDTLTAKGGYESAYWGKVELLGPSHPSTLETLAMYVALLMRVGLYEEALKLHTIALRGYAAMFGETHTSTVNAEYQMAKILEGCGGAKRWEEAKVYLLKVKQACEGQDPNGQKLNLEMVEKDLKNLDDKISGKSPSGFPRRFGGGN